jgi:hypothetical protein
MKKAKNSSHAKPQRTRRKVKKNYSLGRQELQEGIKKRNKDSALYVFFLRFLLSSAGRDFSTFHLFFLVLSIDLAFEL